MRTTTRLAGLILLAPAMARGAEFDGATLNPVWTIPFVGILLSIALLPLFAGAFWRSHYGKVSAAWSLAFLLPCAWVFGSQVALELVAHALIAEYLPFILLLYALYTISGGILLEGNLRGSPAVNTGLLAMGALLASLMGTTGAAVLLIRPLLRANDQRKHRVHIVMFFIFLVANIGGGLTPLGDPPLFLGFLKGVDFFWTLRHMALPVGLLTGVLLGLFYLLDRHFYRQPGESSDSDPTPDSPLRVRGAANFLLLAGVVAAVLISGLWRPGIGFRLLAADIELQNLLRGSLMLILAGVSLAITPASLRAANGFTWEPIAEVGKLFAGIFICIAPAIAILRAGSEGGLAGLVALVSDGRGAPIDVMYFWVTGALSSVLDNAPTYLVFFNLASGDAALLMQQAPTLLAISMGSVFMGALTYVGNAPNFMVKSIAEQSGVNMPSFFGYLFWSCLVLLPLFGLLGLALF